MKTIYLLIGVPASGKSWVAERLERKLYYISHDDHIDNNYLNAIIDHVESHPGPFLCDTPFSISSIKEPLENAGHKVVPVFILEEESVLDSRWHERGTRPIDRQRHLTRQKTYRFRCAQWDSIYGTSEEVLKQLQEKI